MKKTPTTTTIYRHMVRNAVAPDWRSSATQFDIEEKLFGTIYIGMLVSSTNNAYVVEYVLDGTFRVVNRVFPWEVQQIYPTAFRRILPDLHLHRK